MLFLSTTILFTTIIQNKNNLLQLHNNIMHTTYEQINYLHPQTPLGGCELREKNINNP